MVAGQIVINMVTYLHCFNMVVDIASCYCLVVVGIIGPDAQEIEPQQLTLLLTPTNRVC